MPSNEKKNQSGKNNNNNSETSLCQKTIEKIFNALITVPQAAYK